MSITKSSIPAGITRDHVLAAIERINTKGHSPHGASVRYVVEHNGKFYPPLAVAAFAIEACTGSDTPAGSLSGGPKTPAFRMLAKHGFEPRRK